MNAKTPVHDGPLGRALPIVMAQVAARGGTEGLEQLSGELAAVNVEFPALAWCCIPSTTPVRSTVARRSGFASTKRWRSRWTVGTRPYGAVIGTQQASGTQTDRWSFLFGSIGSVGRAGSVQVEPHADQPDDKADASGDTGGDGFVDRRS